MSETYVKGPRATKKVEDGVQHLLENFCSGLLDPGTGACKHGNFNSAAWHCFAFTLLFMLSPTAAPRQRLQDVPFLP